jgi:diaminopimelate epimerase
MKTAAKDLHFHKMSGAGNDFVVINASSAAAVPNLGELALEVCRRRTSVGADGLIVVGPSARPDADVRIRFWNPDGREFGTCGNGTRCAAHFAVLDGLAPAEMVIETGEVVALRYRARPTVSLDLTLSSPHGPQRGHLVQIGVPHLVVAVATLPDEPIEPLCRPLRHAPELDVPGANVNLVEVVDRHRIRIRTYERGVEAETLACGSGSMSCAIALSAAGQVESPVEVETRSGETLTVRFQPTADGTYGALELRGPARVVYRGQLSHRETG